MKTLSLWLQRLCIVGFLLFAWYIDPFSRFAPAFPLVWSLIVAATAWVLPHGFPLRMAPGPGRLAAEGLLVGALTGLTIGAADWSVLDTTLLFEFCWALMPLFLFDRFFTLPWRMGGTVASSPR